MIGLVGEAGVFLVAFGWKTYVVKLHFVHAGLGYELRQGDGIILHLGIRGIGPDQLAVLAPGLAGAVRFHGQFRMGGYEVLVAEDSDPGNGVHVLRMQETGELGQVVDVVLLSTSERVVKGNVDDAVAVFDIKHYGVAADFAPMTDDPQAAVAAGHNAGQVDGTYFEILGADDRFLYNR